MLMIFPPCPANGRDGGKNKMTTAIPLTPDPFWRSFVTCRMAESQTATLQFQKASRRELDLLRDMHIRTFRDTYAEFNTEEDMQLHIATVFSPDRLLAEMEDPRIGYYMAYLGDIPVGFTRVNQAGVQTDVNDPKSLELERIYVEKEWKGRKFGDQLMEHAMGLAREAGMHYLWLGVWEKNLPAIRFYERNGFAIFGTHHFVLGSDPQSDWLMRKDC
jgi:diamine N-acetyltransferase